MNAKRQLPESPISGKDSLISQHEVEDRDRSRSRSRTGAKKPAKKPKPVLRTMYILDTNVLIDDPRSPFAFEEHDVVIPLVVLEELDKLKITMQEAREAIRELYKLGLSEEWTELESGGRLRAETGRTFHDVSVLLKNNDNNIITITLGLTEKFGPGAKGAVMYEKVVLVSNDLNAGVKARSFGLQSEVYKTNEATLIGDETDVLPKLIASTKELEAMITNTSFKLAIPDLIHAQLKAQNVSLNSGVLICSDDQDKTLQFSAIYKGTHLIATDQRNNFVWHNGVIKPFVPDYWKAQGVSSNPEQEVYIHALFDVATTSICAYGRAGTGKTLMAVAAGLDGVMTGQYDKILITKPQVGSGQDIGFLPGSKEDKMDSWIAPMRDHIISQLKKKKGRGKVCNTSELPVVKSPPQRKAAKKDGEHHESCGSIGNKELFQGLIDSGMLEIEATMFARGRSLERTFIIIDEGQNLSAEQVKTWMTRAGTGSKLVVTGDIEQIDSPFLRKNSNGLAVLADRSRAIGWAFSIHLILGVRSEMSDWAANNL